MIQVNCNHSNPVSAIWDQTVKRKDAKLMFIGEPNIALVNGTPNGSWTAKGVQVSSKTTQP